MAGSFAESIVTAHLATDTPCLDRNERAARPSRASVWRLIRRQMAALLSLSKHERPTIGLRDLRESGRSGWGTGPSRPPSLPGPTTEGRGNLDEERSPLIHLPDSCLRRNHEEHDHHATPFRVWWCKCISLPGESKTCCAQRLLAQYPTVHDEAPGLPAAHRPREVQRGEAPLLRDPGGIPHFLFPPFPVEGEEAMGRE